MPPAANSPHSPDRTTRHAPACARVELELILTDPEVDQSARHTLDAQQFPARSFPSWPGKPVPGRDEALHRVIDADKQAAQPAAGGQHM